MTYKLKIEKAYYEMLLAGTKKAELRLHDRPYQAGDSITFDAAEYSALFTITSVCVITPNMLRQWWGIACDADLVLLSLEMVQ